MTNREKIQSHNEDLRKCIDLAENLPEAGGGSIETCTVELPGCAMSELISLIFSDGQSVMSDISGYPLWENFTVSVAKNSVLYLEASGFGLTIDGNAEVVWESGGFGTVCAWIAINSDCSISVE